MNTGSFPHFITFQRQVEQRDSEGGVDPEAGWTTFKKRWGKVHWLTGRETYTAQQFSASVDSEITLQRYTSGLEAKMRAVWNGRTFDIQAVMPLDRKRGLRLLTKEQID